MRAMRQFQKQTLDIDSEVIRLAQGAATQWVVPPSEDDIAAIISHPKGEEQECCRDVYRATRDAMANPSLTGAEFRSTMHKLYTTGTNGLLDRGDQEPAEEYANRVTVMAAYSQLGAVYALGEHSNYGQLTSAIAGANTLYYVVTNHAGCGEMPREALIDVAKAAINFLEFDGEPVVRQTLWSAWSIYKDFREEMILPLLEQMQSQTRHQTPLIERMAHRAAADASMLRAVDNFLVGTFSESLFTGNPEDVRFYPIFSKPTGHLINTYGWCAQVNASCMSRSLNELKYRNGTSERVTAMLADSDIQVTQSMSLVFETMRMAGSLTSMNAGLARSLFGNYVAIRSHRE